MPRNFGVDSASTMTFDFFVSDGNLSIQYAETQKQIPFHQYTNHGKHPQTYTSFIRGLQRYTRSSLSVRVMQNAFSLYRNHFHVITDLTPSTVQRLDGSPTAIEALRMIHASQPVILRGESKITT